MSHQELCICCSIQKETIDIKFIFFLKKKKEKEKKNSRHEDRTYRFRILRDPMPSTEHCSKHRVRLALRQRIDRCRIFLPAYQNIKPTIKYMFTKFAAQNPRLNTFVHNLKIRVPDSTQLAAS